MCSKSSIGYPLTCASSAVFLFSLGLANGCDRRANERERQRIQAERDTKNSVLRTHETDLHRLELEESECRNQLRDKDELERRIEEMKAEIAAANTRLKVRVSSRNHGRARPC